jgi:hypothetical protein
MIQGFTARYALVVFSPTGPASPKRRAFSAEKQMLYKQPSLLNFGTTAKGH